MELCPYCLRPLRKNRTIDHVIPRSAGGRTEPDNTVMCCPTCNHAKTNMSLLDFCVYKPVGARIYMCDLKSAHAGRDMRR